LAVVAALLGGCASRPGSTALSAVSDDVPGTSHHTILVASSRERDARPGVFYSGERADGLSFARVEMSVPPTHRPGQVEYPKQATPNPATDMVVRDAVYHETPAQFLTDIRTELAKRPKGKRDVFIFVHGYNTLYSEALYRAVQMAEDSRSHAVPVLFTWASRGSLTDYVYDTNSATAARDGLEQTIRLAFDSGADKVSILAHSMGNWATVEALRQIKISGRGLPPNRLGNVILASPDIDVDVFKVQLARFGRPEPPFIVIVSADDKALGVSDFIAGGKPRLGAYTKDTELVELGAVVVDMSGVKSDDALNHGKFTQLAQLAPELRSMLVRGRGHDADADVSGIQFHGLNLFRLPLGVPKIQRGSQPGPSRVQAAVRPPVREAEVVAHAASGGPGLDAATEAPSVAAEGISAKATHSESGSTVVAGAGAQAHTR